MLAHNLSQPATDAIAGNGATNRARRDETGPKSCGVICGKNAEDQQTTAFNPAVLFYPGKFIGAGQPPISWKCEEFAGTLFCHSE